MLKSVYDTYVILTIDNLAETIVYMLMIVFKKNSMVFSLNTFFYFL